MPFFTFAPLAKTSAPLVVCPAMQFSGTHPAQILADAFRAADKVVGYVQFRKFELVERYRFLLSNNRSTLLLDSPYFPAGQISNSCCQRLATTEIISCTVNNVGSVGKSGVLMANVKGTVGVQNILTLFCSVFGKDTLQLCLELLASRFKFQFYL